MSELFRTEALAARQARSGPGRLLGRARFGRLWALLLAAALVSLAAGLAIRVDSYASGAAGVDARSGQVVGVVAGPVGGGVARVSPAGRCRSAAIAATLRRHGGWTLVAGTLPRSCRGAGGAARLEIRRGMEPLLGLLWRELT